MARLNELIDQHPGSNIASKLFLAHVWIDFFAWASAFTLIFLWAKTGQLAWLFVAPVAIAIPKAITILASRLDERSFADFADSHGVQRDEAVNFYRNYDWDALDD